VSGSFPNNLGPSGINAVRSVRQKTYRTAVALRRICITTFPVNKGLYNFHYVPG
jgi:hypothetical protein